jgi:glyoxylase I family protein
MIHGIHHTSLSTNNLARLGAFYRDLLGFEQITTFDWDETATEIHQIVGMPGSKASGIFLRAGRSLIEIFEWTPAGREANEGRLPNAVGITHMSFDVVDLDHEYERLQRAGVKFNSKPITVRNMIKACFGYDPDGNIFELQELLDQEHVFKQY